MECDLNKKVTILVCTCDSYEDLWHPFFKLLDEYWPDNNCRIILNTETKSYSYNNLDIVSYSVGKSPYGERMIRNLEKIKTPFTLLLLDDFFLRRPINSIVLHEMVNEMEKDKDIAALYCDKNDYTNDNTICNVFYQIKQRAPYKLNMQAGLWRTATLRKYWNPKDNPWIWEIFVNYTTFNTADKFYALRNLDEAPIYYGYNPEGMGVFRGKWVVDDVKPLFDKHGIDIDFSKRGYYDPQNAVARLPIFEVMPYVFKRIPFKYALTFSVYAIAKRILLLFGISIKYKNLAEYLGSKSR